MAEDLSAFPLLMGGMKGYSAIGSANQAAQQRALRLRTTASTGQYQAPFHTPDRRLLSDAIRQFIYGQGAAGGLLEKNVVYHGHEQRGTDADDD